MTGWGGVPAVTLSSSHCPSHPDLDGLMTLISVAKAAEILGIARATAYRLASTGRLPCVRSLGPLRIHLEKLHEMIDAEAEENWTAKPGVREVSSISSRQVVPTSHKPQAALEREFDELLQAAKSRRKRNR